MSNDYNASVVISTSESEAGIRKLDSATKDLDKTLQNLHKSLQTGQGDLDKVASSMTALTRANATLIKSEQDRAKATVLAAKADGQIIVNQGKRQKSAGDAAIAEAKAAKIRQGTLSAGLAQSATVTRRDAEARVRMASTEALGQARVTTELTRTAVAQQNLAGATIRTASASEAAAARTAKLENAQRRTASGTLELNDSLSNSRYLLYDVGQTYTVLATALEAIPIATAAVAIAYERDFAQVIRTNDSLKQGNGFAVLRGELKELATEIPLTFGEFANISAIGGQLGVEGKNVEAFTETVARFGAASNVSLDEASTAFGRLQQSFDPLNQTPDFFNKIGSAIAYVGVKSAATETEIIAVNNQISAAGAQFGFTADQVVGLSGALASVRIRPELARGAFQRIMLGLSRAADEGADSFNKFGKYTGLAAEESQALFKSDPSAFLYKYIGGVKAAIKETGSVSSVLDDIGAKNVFDKQFILGLANGYGVFGDSLKNASDAFGKGSFLKESTQGIFDTMDAKLKRIANSIQNLADTVAKGSLSGLSGMADVVLDIAGAADRFAKATPGFVAFLNIVLGLGSAIGILLAFKAAQAFVLAGIVGFQQVLGKGTLAAGLTAKGILQQVAVTMLMAKGASQEHAQALVVQAGAFKAMGIAAQTSAAQVQAGTLAGIGGVSNAAPVATSRLRGLTGGLKSLASGALGLVGGPIGAAVIGLTTLGLAFMQVEEKANTAGEAIGRAMKNGAEAAKTEIGNQLTDRKVELTDNIFPGNLGKNTREIAKEVGISFQSMVNAIMKGQDAAKNFAGVLNELGRSKGAKDYADALSKGLITSGQDQQIKFLAENVKSLGDRSSKTQDDIKAVDEAAGKLGGTAADATPSVDGIKEAIEGAGDESETAAEKLDKFINGIFSIVDASGATQEALQQLGEGLANSSDFGPGTEGGRQNVDNFREALKAAALEQQQLIDTTGKSTQEASADYIAFVEGLVSEMASRGVDPASISAMAEQAKYYFGSTLMAGEQPKIGVQLSPESAQAAAVDAGQQVQGYINSLPEPDVFVGANTTTATGKMMELARSLAQITGYPYEVVLDALTNPAAEKSKEIYALITSITNQTYTAPIGADTSAAISNVRNFANYANQQLSAVQSAYNTVAASAPTLAKYTKSTFAGVKGVTSNVPASIARPSSSVSVPQVAAPTQVAATAATPNFGALGNGYDKVKKAAEKAGEAGKKAGQDMEDGISDAARAADDYANRLKTGLTAAFDQQYGVQKATDEYYSTLNNITKKRQDELDQIDDLISKQKELNDAKAEELVNARKAGIEKEISLKYGEVDRASDYAQQETEALNAAAAKQKDIDANYKQVSSLQAGIGLLDGYSEAAIENREALRNLESKMIDMISAYAATGASQEQVRAYAQRLTAQFRNDAGQVSDNRTAVQLLTGDMNWYTRVINAVPVQRTTVMSADTGKGIQDLQGFDSNAAWAARPRQVHMDLTIGQEFENFLQKKGKYATLNDIDGLTFRPGGTLRVPGLTGGATGGSVGKIAGFASGGQVPGKAPSNLSTDNRLAKVDGRGLIGIQSEEFIMQKRAVDYWGLDLLNSMNSMKMPAFNAGGSTGGGASSSGANGPLLVELTAENLATILRLADRPVDLYAGVEKLASTVAEGNAILASKGVIN